MSDAAQPLRIAVAKDTLLKLAKGLVAIISEEKWSDVWEAIDNISIQTDRIEMLQAGRNV